MLLPSLPKIDEGGPNNRSSVQLSPPQQRVLHVERSPWYGGHTEATIKLTRESVQQLCLALGPDHFLVRGAESLPFSSSEEEEVAGQGRGEREGRKEGKERADGLLPQGILLDLAPVLLFYDGPLATELVEENLSAYVEFMPIPGHGIVVPPSSACSEGVMRGKESERWCFEVLSVPRSKEQIMLSDQLSLVEKRQLMRLISAVDGGKSSPVQLQSLLGEAFAQVTDRVRSLLQYGLAMVPGAGSGDADGNDRNRTRTHTDARSLSLSLSLYTRSLARSQGEFALLYPAGGSNSLAQAYCRAAALGGTLHILRTDLRLPLIAADEQEKDSDNLKDNDRGDEAAAASNRGDGGDQGNMHGGGKPVLVEGSFEGEPWRARVHRIVGSDEQWEARGREDQGGEGRKKGTVCRAAIIYERMTMNDSLNDNGIPPLGYWIVPPRVVMPEQETPLYILHLDHRSGCCPTSHGIIYLWSDKDDDEEEEREGENDCGSNAGTNTDGRCSSLHSFSLLTDQLVSPSRAICTILYHSKTPGRHL